MTPGQEQADGGPRCAECGRSVATGRTVAGGICGAVACRASLVARIEKARAARRRGEQAQELTRLRRAWRRRLAQVAKGAGCASGQVALGQVPGVPAAPLMPLPPDRRARFETHLRQVVATAFHDDPAPEAQPDDSGATPVIAGACGACRGHCCELGADSHAFVTPGMIATTRLSRPTLDIAGMVALYLGALPARSVPGSCVFHGAAGCTLARDDRSTLCNRYLCDGVRAAMAAHRPDLPILIVARPETGRARSCVVPGSRARPAP